MIPILVLVAAVAVGQPAAAQLDAARLLQIEPRHYVAYRALGDLRLDGRLDEPSWQRAPWTEAFVDIEGDVRPQPRFRTRAKILWDDTYLYIAADLEEPDVWATLTERDAVIYHDNDFEVFIDPDGDTHQYYEFEINALGTEWDLFLVKPYRDGGPYLSAWDIQGLETAAQVWGTINNPRDQDQGWSLEMAFPWAVLGECAHGPAPPADGAQWRINFSRVEWQVQPEPDGDGYHKVAETREDNWVWSPQGLINMHFPEQWGYVQFSSRPAGGASADFRLPPEREGQLLLREIYYRQVEYRRAHGRYAASLDTLGVAHRLLRSFLWPPRLQATDHAFEAAVEEVEDLHGDGWISTWVIGSDSRLWKADPRQEE
ncbi:MAG: carbohydrate-binding family 9-like protein [Gemmatimonadota bacterium]